MLKLFIIFMFATSFKVSDENIQGIVCAKTPSSVSVCSGTKEFKINQPSLTPFFVVGDTVIMVIRDGEFNGLLKK